MDAKEILSGLILELRRGSLTLLVLSQLHQPTYGYKLVKTLEEHNIVIEGNTLYPLMRRLEAQGLLESKWEVSEAKPRKYYIITPLGTEVLKKMKIHYANYAQNINNLLYGGPNDGKE